MGDFYEEEVDCLSVFLYKTEQERGLKDNKSLIGQK